MVMMTFTVEEALRYAKQSAIEEWVHSFLNSVGNNRPFSDGLKLQKRYWTGPFEIRLDRLTRCCGPEPTMKYYIAPESWEREIETFCTLIQQGWDMPPLIVEHKDGQLIVNDGNHRLEAMVRLKIQSGWVIVWNSYVQDEIHHFAAP